ncbi:MAG: transcriptional regulator, TetR family [Deltaproteobacteria bacterium]|nr:transcriptional regulator, TetR family [Deltaproteobacteria bacterium]
MVQVGERSTRERILEVAEAFFGERGYDGTKLQLIAQNVGIQKASLFHYFPSKEHLYRAVLQRGLGESEETTLRIFESQASPLEKVRAAIDAYVDMVAARPARTKILLRQSIEDAPGVYQQVAEPQRLLNLVVGFVVDGQRTQVFAPIDPVALVLGIGGMVVFFFTSAPVLAPVWCGDTSSKGFVNRVKRHVIDVVERCLTVGMAARPAAAVGDA